MSKNIKEKLQKLLIKLLAPSTVCYSILGLQKSTLKYWSFLPICLVISDAPIGKDGFYKSIYMNGKRVKPWTIIPRNSTIEVRKKPKGIVSLIFAIVALQATLHPIIALTIVGVAAMAVAGVVLGVTAARGVSSGSDKPKYSSNNSPSLTGAKNELAEGIVPVSFGKCLQVFNYAQFATPLVKSGFGGNRYRVYFIPGYKNARYEDFRLKNVLLSSYRASAYTLQQSNGGSAFIGWDNAVTETFNKELSFDLTAAVYQSAIAYYNKAVSGTSVSITQVYHFTEVDLTSWTDKVMNISATFVADGIDRVVAGQTTITSANLVSDGAGGYNATKTTSISFGAYTASEYRYTSTSPDSTTRGDGEVIDITLSTESITVGSSTYSDTVEQGVNSYTGDVSETISQSPSKTKFCDVHFSFPQGLFSINASTGGRNRVKISAELQWKRKTDVPWRDLNDPNISRIYTRDIDGVVQNLSSRITVSGNKLTFKTPGDLNYADDNFFECVGLEFVEDGEYLIRAVPVAFKKSNYWTGAIYIANVIWRLRPDIPVVDYSILPHVTQVACTFNATTQLDGEVDALGAIARPYVKNLETGLLEQSRNPVDIIYYLITDSDSNPDPMSESSVDIPSFIAARKWCNDHGYLCDGIISSEVRYEVAVDEIASNCQLYLIPNKWGKTVLRIDTNEDGRPIKTFFNAENSWDLQITRQRGSLDRMLALRCSYIDEETWSSQEITGYWYNGKCNWEPEAGKDDTYYKPEKKDIEYLKNIDSVKRRIAYELEIANEKGVTATFNVAREVLNLEVLDRCLVADYTRIDDGICGTISSVIKNSSGDVVGLKLDTPVTVKEGMEITIRSVDTSGGEQNVNIYPLSVNNPNETYRIIGETDSSEYSIIDEDYDYLVGNVEITNPISTNSSSIYFKTPIPASESIIRGSGFYKVDGTEFYHSGDIYMLGTAEILNMVIKEIEEVKGDDFTSKITCRLY